VSNQPEPQPHAAPEFNALSAIRKPALRHCFVPESSIRHTQVNIIAAESGKTRPDVARRRAWVAAATMIGALTVSRIVTDSELSASILREAKKQLVNSR
jgi:hypothetical protein